jgi:hypothetical protein
MSEHAKFEKVLSDFLEGSLSSDELATLEARLASDETFADEFARWCLAHRQIMELLAESKLHRLMDQFVTSSPGLPKAALRQPSTLLKRALNKSTVQEPRDGKLVRRIVHLTRSHMGMLAALTAAAGVIAFWTLRRPSQPDMAEQGTAQVTAAQVAAPDQKKPSPAVATLTQVVDGVWADGAPMLHHGQQLEVGTQVALASGMVKVTYDCGAEVVLEGPCDFWLHSPMVGYLNSGRITANVPRRAFTFAILSPHVDMVDLGTSFGVDIGANGRTELHVFEGEVLCSEPNRDAAAGRARTSPIGSAAGERTFRLDRSPPVIHVTAQNAMEFGAAPGRPSGIAMNEEQFSRLLALRRAAEVQAGHLAEDELALWLAADVAVTTDSYQRVISWQDIVYGDNQSAEDAVQVDEAARPLVVESAINGRRAIRFDGKSDFLLTTPLETTDDQTVLFVCQFTPNAYDKSRRWGGQIINYDGPPSRYLSNTLEPGVLQIGEPLLEQEFRPTLLTGQVFAGFIGSAVVESGRVNAEQVGANTPVIVAFVYDYEYEHGKASLTINGRSYGTTRAFAPQGITSRKIIGRHAWMQNYFHGDLAELLIFNKALSAEELAQTTAYLADKYQIAVGE